MLLQTANNCHCGFDVLHYYSITYNNATLFFLNYCLAIENKHSYFGFFSLIYSGYVYSVGAF